VLRALARLESQLAPELPPGVPHGPAAEARLAAGLPALLDEPLVELPAFQTVLCKMAQLLEAESLFSTIKPIADWMATDEVQGRDFAAAAVAGNWEMIEAAAARQGIDPYASVLLLDYAVRPWLRLAARAVNSLVGASQWSAGHCPACGAAPLLAELRGAERERVLRCGRCATAWSFPRLACASCGERRHQQLSYLHDAGQAEFRRADVCETCRSYLKAIAVLDPLNPLELLEADLESGALDFVAIEQGYRRGQVQPT
jgi:FdhE protein